MFALAPDLLGNAPQIVGAAATTAVEFEAQYATCRPSEQCGRKRDVDDAPLDTLTADVTSMFRPCPPTFSWVGVVKLNVDPG